MHSRIKRIVRILAAVLAVLLLLLAAMAVWHHVLLKLEADQIAPVGTLVEVDGFRMNVSAEGERRSAEDPTVILLSGSGVAAPLYDYKILYSKLSGAYRVVVVEKFGYGYSDISGLPRDVATLVEQSRRALEKAGEAAPYVLMPHSMSALEAIYWAYTYPDEVAAIVGLDMAVPDSYQADNIAQITLLKVSTVFGFHRIPFFNPVNGLSLTDEELEQHKLLSTRNSLNADVYEECRTVFQNAQTVRDMDIADVPLLMFTTNLGGSGGGAAWMAAQDAFAARMNRCEQIRYSCGHNLHYEKSQEMAEHILSFLQAVYTKR